MTILIDGADALRLLENAVAAKGADYVYPRNEDSITKSCTYARNGEPSCGVGYALHAAGVSTTDLAILDRADELLAQEDADNKDCEDIGQYTTTIGDEAIRYFLRNTLDVIITDQAQNVFSAFQTAQDSGEDWGFSLECSKRVLSV